MKLRCEAVRLKNLSAPNFCAGAPKKKNVGAPVQPWQTVSPEPRPKHHSQFVILTALNAVLTSVIIHCVKYVHQHISQYASHLNSTALSLSSALFAFQSNHFKRYSDVYERANIATHEQQ